MIELKSEDEVFGSVIQVKLTKKQIAVYELLIKNNHASYAELALSVDCTKKTIANIVAVLLRHDLINVEPYVQRPGNQKYISLKRLVEYQERSVRPPVYRNTKRKTETELKDGLCPVMSEWSRRAWV